MPLNMVPPAKQNLVEILRDVSSQLKSLTTAVNDLRGIVVEQSQDISDIRAHTLDDADRIGRQVHVHESAITGINARLAAHDKALRQDTTKYLRQDSPAAETIRPGTRSTGRKDT